MPTLDSSGRLVDRGGIVALRPADVALATAVREEWTRIGLATGPADRAVAERAVAEAYREAGLDEPAHIVWFGSPLAGIFACALLTERLRPKLLDPPPDRRSRVAGLLRRRSRPDAGRLAGAEYAEQIWAELARQVGPGVAELPGLRVRREVSDTNLAFGEALAASEVGPVVSQWAVDEVGSGVHDALWPTVVYPHDEHLRTTVDRYAPAEVSSWVRGMMVDAAGGQFEAPVLARIDYLNRLSTGETELPWAVAPLATLARQVGMWWPLRHVAIVTERPARRGGADDGPALVYPDGVEVPATPEPSQLGRVSWAPPMVDDDGRLVTAPVGSLPAVVRDHRDLPDLSERLTLAGFGPMTADLLALAAPSLRLRGKGSDALGTSRIGGAPDLAPGQRWPTVRDGGQEWSLPFVAQLDLAELSRLDLTGQLPSTGLLSFFFDEEQYNQWPYDDHPPQPDGGWAVLYTDGDDLRPRPLPDDLPDELRYDPVPVTPESELTLPGVNADACRVDLDEMSADYIELTADWIQDLSGVHRVLGHADLKQGDPGEGWLLLLQLDNDTATGFDWGMDGRLFFHIHPDDLRDLRFDRVRCTLQR